MQYRGRTDGHGPCAAAGRDQAQRFFDHRRDLQPVVSPESMFTLNRPTASEDGQTAQVQPGPWDGVYR
jgi:hypothetical protein